MQANLHQDTHFSINYGKRHEISSTIIYQIKKYIFGEQLQGCVNDVCIFSIIGKSKQWVES